MQTSRRPMHGHSVRYILTACCVCLMLSDRYDEAATVHDVFKRITAFQGHRVEGPKDEAALAVVVELEKLRNSNMLL